MTKKILIVEDDESLGYMEGLMAESAGYDVYWLPDATNVVAEVRERKPDVIVMDVMMPMKSGLEAIKELRADPIARRVPVLFVSVVDLPKQFPEVLKRKSVSFLQKPFELDDLIAKIHSLLPETD